MPPIFLLSVYIQYSTEYEAGRGRHNQLFYLQSVDFLGKGKGLVSIWELVTSCIEQSEIIAPVK